MGNPFAILDSRLSNIESLLIDIKHPPEKELHTQEAKNDLMTRDQVLELLQINASTLWHWQNKKKIIVYKYANKNYYKRSEILENLKPVNK